MEFKGTKGKWEMYIGEIRATIYVDKGSNFIDCWGGGIANVNNEEMEANALLISKAPEMLEMLTYLSETMREFDGWRDEYNKIKRLIKEATEL